MPSMEDEEGSLSDWTVMALNVPLEPRRNVPAQVVSVLSDTFKCTVADLAAH